MPHTNVQNLTSTYPLPPPPHPAPRPQRAREQKLCLENREHQNLKKNAFREKRNTRKILLRTREQGTPWEALKTMFNFQLKVPVYFCLILFDSIGGSELRHFQLITVIKINILRFYGNGKELDVLLR